MKTATIAGGTARFDLSGVVAGNYFIRVNGLADDLVPTRFVDPANTTSQFVGQKLIATVIGSLSDPTYRIRTFSKGQGQHPAVIYYDGTNEIPEQYAYVMLSLKTSPQKFEILVLGTAFQLNNYSPAAATHPSTSTSVNPPFSTWIFSGSDHADDYNGTDSKCNTCHGNLATKPAAFSDITVSNGWCFRCHYGKAGTDAGFIDTTAVFATTPTIVPATVTSTPATPAPTRTPGTPAFEAFLAILVMLITVLARRR